MKKVVILGGGFAGTHIARKLEIKFDVTLIDSKDYFEFTPGIPRTLVEPEHRKRIQARHPEYLQKTKIIKGNVKKITKEFIETKKDKIKFDYLIICTGSRYSLPFKKSDIILVSRTKNLIEYNEKLKSSKSILIVGGGLVGVELASEIITNYPDKKITIVHAKDRLIERNPEEASRYAEEFLKKRGVKIIFNERVIEHKNDNYKTNKETKIETDLAFSCTGIIPNSEFLRKGFKESLDEKKFIKTNEYLQTEFPHIFVAGDISDRLEEKTAQNALWQANIVIKNIKNLENKKNLKEYKSKKTPLVISLGKYDGIFVWNKLVLTGIFPGVLKSLIEFQQMTKYKKFF